LTACHGRALELQRYGRAMSLVVCRRTKAKTDAGERFRK
jgi:hypothetical protein